MKKYFLLISILSIVITGCSIEEEKMLKDAAVNNNNVDSINDIIEQTVEVEISGKETDGASLIVSEMERLINTLDNCIETVDSIIEPENITEKINIKDFNGNIMYSIISEDNESLYIVIPQLNRTYILTGKAIEEYLYSFIEYGTGIRLQDYK